MPRRRAYTRQLTVRLSGEELEVLHRHAETAGLSLSRYLVETGLIGCPPPNAAERAQRQRALFHARKIGVNLNQLARQLNGEAAVPAEPLTRALEAATQVLHQLAGKGEES
jgi:hypothetical protein